MNRSRIALTLLGFLMGGRALLAHAPVPIPPRPAQRFEAHTEHRQAFHQHRIAQGMERGELTPRETLRLERQRVRIDRSIHHTEAGGRMTQFEASRLQHQQLVASHRTYSRKHHARMMP